MKSFLLDPALSIQLYYIPKGNPNVRKRPCPGDDPLSRFGEIVIPGQIV
jgi:hypothetical protein